MRCKSLTTILLIAKRELSAYFQTPMGYIVVALVLIVEGLLYNYAALGGSPKYSTHVLRIFLELATFMTMVSGILLAMRLFAEEKQLGSFSLLLTAPVHDYEIVLGKFLSALVFLSLMTGLSLYMPLMIFFHGKVSVGHIAAGYCGLLGLGAFSIAIGTMSSALAPNQIVAAITGAALLSALNLLRLGAKLTESPLRDILLYLSPQNHWQSQYGVLRSSDAIYYLCGCYFFLLLATQIVHARRWR